MLMLDLCSGLGGASQPFKDAGWKVITLDNNSVFNSDICTDILTWRYIGFKPDFIWASPPCTEFSRNSLPWNKNKNQPVPDMSIMLKCYQIIIDLSPRWWVIENVKGAVKYFQPVLGRPSYVCNPYYLWGRFPDISYVRVISNKEQIKEGKNRAALRGKIPYRISENLVYQIEHRIELPEFSCAF